jgi:hypothetical protein
MWPTPSIRSTNGAKSFMTSLRNGPAAIKVPQRSGLVPKERRPPKLDKLMMNPH